MTKTNSPDLQEVLTSFAVSGKRADPKALREWIKLYPQFKRQLTALAARPPPDPASLPPEPGEKEWVKEGVARLQASLDKLPPAPVAEAEPIAGLFSEAKKRGYRTPDAFADKVGLPMALMSMLDQRHFRFASIPGAISSALSHALGISVEAISKFLDGAPRMSPGMAFKSKKPPKMPEQVDFRETFASDPDVTEKDRKRWKGLL